MNEKRGKKALPKEALLANNNNLLYLQENKTKQNTFIQNNVYLVTNDNSKMNSNPSSHGDEQPFWLVELF